MADAVARIREQLRWAMPGLQTLRLEHEPKAFTGREPKCREIAAVDGGEREGIATLG